jgi:predicted permease
LAKDCARDVWVWRWLQSVAQDARFAVRLLVKDPWFALVVVVVLGIGIALTNAMFTMLNAALFRGLPIDDARIVALSTRDALGRESGVSLPDFRDWQEATHAFAGTAAYFDIAMNVSDADRAPELFSGPYISADVFRLLRITPILGRDFQPEDDRAGAPGTVILGYSLWKNRYGGNPAVIGRTILVNDRPSVVIGVMPQGFKFPFQSDLWMPLGSQFGATTPPRNARTHAAFGRLADGVTLPQARADLEAVADRLAQEHPDTNKSVRPVVVRFSERYTCLMAGCGSAIKRLFVTLMGAVSFVLLIACANVANLLLARSVHRSREMSLRVSLGATRSRLVRQLLVESMLLALLAGVLGLGLSVTAVRLMSDQMGAAPYWVRWTMDGRVFAFLTATSLATGLAFGVAPALHISRTNVNDTIKDSGRIGGGSVRVRRWTTGLMVAEVALTLMLLTGGGLLIRSFLALYRASFVIDASQLTTMGIRLSGRKYSTQESRRAFYDKVEERLGAIGQISSATIASNVPLSYGYIRFLSIEGRPTPAGDVPPTVTYITIGSRYFETLGLRMLRGRTFAPIDGTPGHEHAIVNERFVSMFFPNEDPIGRRIRLTNQNVIAATLPWVTIIGVSPTVRQMSTLSDPDPVAYLPFHGDAGYFAGLIVRDRSEPGATTSLIREQLRALDPDLPLFGIMPLEQAMAGSRAFHRSIGTLFGIFAIIALLLASVGLYAVTAYSVTQRTQEIGIRMALGAAAAQVTGSFVRRATVPLGVGLAVGLAGSVVLGRLLRTWLVQTDPLDPLTLLSVASLLLIVALGASFFPARRAARVDPIVALRCE